MKDTVFNGNGYPHGDELKANGYSMTSEFTLEGKLNVNDGAFFAMEK